MTRINKTLSIIIWVLCLCITTAKAQVSISADTSTTTKNVNDSLKKGVDIVKTGYNMVPLPDVRRDPYVGLRMGVFVFLYNYGDGKRYPNYYNYTDVGVSYSTKGAVNAEIKHKRYDGRRIYTAEIRYQDQQAAPFFGFNGYQTVYNKDFLNLNSDQTNYPKNTYFYNIKQENINLNIEIQDTIKGTYINWLAASYSGWYEIHSVNISSLNKNKTSGNSGYVSETADNLYSLYKSWGIIDPKIVEGGKFYTTLKGELIYDHRERITNPYKGILSRIGVSYTPKFGTNSQGNTLGINAGHTQYITLIKKRLTFVYRLKYQGYFGEQIPFFIQEGIGGIKSNWGVLQNRALVRQWITGQFDLRFRAHTKQLFHQNFELWYAPFFHTGYVLQEQKIDLSNVPVEAQDLYFAKNYGKWYSSYGIMAKFVVNNNVVLGLDFAFPIYTSAGKSNAAGPPMSVFIGLGFSCMFP